MATPSSSNSGSTSRRSIVCVLEIFYATNKKAMLEVFSDSKPSALAAEFAKRHQLSDKYRSALERHILDNLRAGPGIAADSNRPPSLSPSSTIATNVAENIREGGALFPSDPFGATPPPPAPEQPKGRRPSEDAREEQHSKMWADLKNHWATPTGYAAPKLHTAHPSVPSKIRASSVSSASSSSLDSQGRRKKGRRKNKKGPVSAKAKKVSNRLYGHASAIKKRHDDRRELHHNAEMEYCNVNQFSTTKKTKVMASKRSTLVMANYSPEVMHELAVMNGGGGADGGSLTSLDHNSQYSVALKKVGSRLHMEAAVKEQRRKKQFDDKRLKELEEELEGCTFTPELSKGTLEVATKRTKGKDNEGGIFHALYEAHVERSQKKAYYEQIAEINEDCTFKPEINKTSEVLNLLGNMEEGTAEVISRPKYEELYAERNKRAEKVEQIKNSLPTTDADECTFKPDIGANKHRATADSNQLDFVNRLYKDHETNLRKKEEKTKKAEEAWFKPEIGRSPLNARNVDNLPIHEHLTAVDKKSQELKKAKLDSHEAKEKEGREFKANPKSEKLLQKMKKRSCEELFRVLLATVDFEGSKSRLGGVVNVNDSFAELVSNMQQEEEGLAEDEEVGGAWRSKLLDPTKCNPDLLDDNVSKIIKPLLARHQGSPLSLEFFLSLVVVELDRVGVEAVDVVRTLRNRAREKKKLMADREEGGGGEKAGSPINKLKGKARFRAVSNIVKQFHPSINKNSAKIVNRGKKKGRGELLFTTLHSAQKIIDAKLDNLRKQKQAEEDIECTFKPTLVAHTYKGASQYPRW